MRICTSFFAMVAIATIGFMSSCSSDSEVEADGDDSVVTNKTITADIGIDDGDEDAMTRLGGDLRYSSGNKNKYFKATISSDNDYFWVYAPDPDVEGGWFNKLAPKLNTDKGEKYPTTLAGYASVSGSTVKFSGGKLVYVIYSALDEVKSQEAHAFEDSKFISNDDGKTIMKFTRSTTGYNNDLAYVYGDCTNPNNIAYTDANNPFSFRIASAVIGSDGYLMHYKNDGNGNFNVDEEQTGSVNIVSFTPKLLFSIPSAVDEKYEAAALDNNTEKITRGNFKTYYEKKSTEVKKYLSKLVYKIVIDAVPYDESGDVASLTGFPSEMTYRLIDINDDNEKGEIDEQKVIVPNSYKFTKGSSLKLYYGTDANPSSLLWNTNNQYSDLKDRDKDKADKKVDMLDVCTGNIYVPLPPFKYKRIRVLVNVSYTGEDEDVKSATEGLCKTYKMDIQNEISDFVYTYETKTSDIKAKVSAVYDLGSIWGTRTEFLGSSSAKTTRAVQPGNGWEIVDDSEFDF